MTDQQRIPPGETISLREKIGFSLGEYASSMVWQTLMFFLPLFYTDTFGLGAGTLATMFVTVRIVDAFADPLMGLLADRTRTRWGRFRPYLLWMAVPFGLGLVLMFTTPALSASGKVVYAYATYALMMLLYTAISIPYNAMVGVVSADPAERASITSYKFIFAFLAGTSVQILIGPLVRWFGAGDGARGYQVSMALFAVVTTGLFWVAFAHARERVQPDPAQKNGVATDLRDLLRNRPWMILFGVSLATLVYVAIRSAAVSYYFKYNLGREAEMGRFMALGTLMTLAGVLPTTWLAARVGKVRLFQTCFALVSLSFAAFYWVDAARIGLIYTIQALGSLVGGPLFPLMWSMVADAVDHAEWKTGRRATGLAFAALTFSQKLGFGLGGWAIMAVLAGAGFVANQVQTPAALQGIRLGVSLIPAGICLAAAVLLFWYRLDEAQMAQVTRELRSRRAAGAGK